MSKNTIRPTEYRAMQKGEIPAPSNKTKENSRAVNENYSQDVTSIVENAFTPGEVEEVADSITRENRRPTPQEILAAARERRAGHVVNSAVYEKPSNGQHFVVVEKDEVRTGRKDGEHKFIIELKDVDKNIKWSMAIDFTDEMLDRFGNEVNSYNIGAKSGVGIIQGLEAIEAIEGKLRLQKFRVWTQQYVGSDGKTYVKTYTNPDSYERFARVQAYKAAEQADKEKAYLEHKARGDKAPWED